MIDEVRGSDEKNEPMEDRRKDSEGERRREKPLDQQKEFMRLLQEQLEDMIE